MPNAPGLRPNPRERLPARLDVRILSRPTRRRRSCHSTRAPIPTADKYPRVPVPPEGAPTPTTGPSNPVDMPGLQRYSGAGRV